LVYTSRWAYRSRKNYCLLLPRKLSYDQYLPINDVSIVEHEAVAQFSIKLTKKKGFRFIYLLYSLLQDFKMLLKYAQMNVLSSKMLRFIVIDRRIKHHNLDVK
jgi:hypothetical protein